MNTGVLALFAGFLMGFAIFLGIASFIEDCVRCRVTPRIVKWALFFFRSLAVTCAVGVFLSMWLMAWGIK